ncbi:MAG: DUF3418 domain-containing protein, partial [Promicromonosporaceae bacterium]|nr:DUF3418 domain-containing protein [Promicromonosporaceae bacterium]
EEFMYEFYDSRIPGTVTSGPEFDKWWQRAKKDNPELLSLSYSDTDSHELDKDNYPDFWPQGDLILPLSYELAPGSEADGVTVHVTPEQLVHLQDAGFDWLVPGLLTDLVIATIRTLPKDIRVQLVPAPDTGKRLADWLRENTPAWTDMARAGDMADRFASAFASATRAVTGVVVDPELIEAGRAKLPAHLRMRFQVEERPTAARKRPGRGAARGRVAEPVVLGASADLADLRQRFAVATPEPTALAVAYESAARISDAKAPGMLVIDDTPGAGTEVVGQTTAAAGAPKLVSNADYVAGVRELLLAENRLPTKRITSRWTGKQATALGASPYASTEDLVTDLQYAGVRALTSDDDDGRGGPSESGGIDLTQIRTAEDLAATHALVRQKLEAQTYQVAADVAAGLTAWRELDTALRNTGALALLATASEIREHAGRLVYPGFVRQIPPAQLRHLARYLTAARYRLEKAASNVARDQELARRLSAFEAEVAKSKAEPEALEAARWLLEELRVSYFAQELGTTQPVSEQRIRKQLSR